MRASLRLALFFASASCSGVFSFFFSPSPRPSVTLRTLGLPTLALRATTANVLESLRGLGESQSILLDRVEKLGPEQRQSVVGQLEQLDNDYPGGLKAYVEKAKRLLKDSEDGVNPVSDEAPCAPTAVAHASCFELR